MIIRKCASCNTENEATACYCKKCGLYLRFVPKPGLKEPSATSIWETISVSPINGSLSVNSTAAPVTESASVCPSCGQRITWCGDRAPLFCPFCNDVFQGGDPVPANQSAGQKPPFAPPATTQQKRTPLAPLTPADADSSALRLICDQPAFLLEVPQQGASFGSGAVLTPPNPSQFPQLRKLHLDFFHHTVGWFFRSLAEDTLWNGMPVILGASNRLSHGDSLIAGGCTLRAELISDQ